MNRPTSDLLRSRLTVEQKRRIAYTRMRFRRPLAGLRDTPDFMVIGAQRGGRQRHRDARRPSRGHPSVRKGDRVLHPQLRRGPSWYRSHFTLRRRPLLRGAPDYLFHPLAPARVATDLPTCRLVVLLREPAAGRSHWQHMTRIGFEQLSFAERSMPSQRTATWRGSRPARPWSRARCCATPTGPGATTPTSSNGGGAVPSEQLLVLRSEELFADPATTLARRAFVGLSLWLPPSFAELERADPRRRPVRTWARRAASRTSGELRRLERPPGRPHRHARLVADQPVT